MTDIQSRIAATLRPFLRWDGPPPHELAERLADFLVAELGLTKEPCQGQPKSRYVTPWETP